MAQIKLVGGKFFFIIILTQNVDKICSHSLKYGEKKLVWRILFYCSHFMLNHGILRIM